MKGKRYYWLAIGVLGLSTLFFLSLAHIQSLYAREALKESEQIRLMAQEQAQHASQMAAIAQQRAFEAENARKEATALLDQLKECKESK